MITQTIDYSTIQQLYAMLYHVMQAVDVPVPEQGVPQLRTPSTSTVDTHIGPRLSPPSKAVGRRPEPLPAVQAAKAVKGIHSAQT